MSDWQPIETFKLPELAPGKNSVNSVPVLVWDGEYQTVAHCLVIQKRISWWVHNSYGFNEDGEIYGVTHWKPLAPPPGESTHV